MTSLSNLQMDVNEYQKHYSQTCNISWKNTYHQMKRSKHPLHLQLVALCSCSATQGNIDGIMKIPELP